MLCFASAVLLLSTLAAHAQTVPPDPPAIPVANLDEALARLHTWSLGQDYTPCEYITVQVLAAQGDLAQRNALADRLAEVITGAAPLDAKVFASQKLYVIATEQQVDTLAPLLTDENLGDVVRYAIEGIPGQKVTNALLAALDKATDKARIGIVNSLATRGVRPDAYYENEGSRIRPEALALMHDSLDLMVAVADGEPVALRSALEALKDTRPQIRRAAMCYLRIISGAGTIKMLVESLDATNGDTKAGLIYALAARGDAQAATAIAQQLNNNDPAVRLAAIRALSAFGDVAQVETLLKVAVSREGEVKKAALESLARMRDPEVQTAKAAGLRWPVDRVAAALADIARHGEPAQRVIAIDTLAERYATDTFSTLYFIAQDADDAVASAAIRALGALSNEDLIGDIVVLLNDETKDSRRAELAQAIVRAMKRFGPDAGVAGGLVEVMDQAQKETTSVAMLGILGELGLPKTLDAIRARSTGEGPVARAALLALAAWPDAALTADLLVRLKAGGLAAADAEAVFNGAVRQLRAPSERPLDETLSLYTDVLALAKDDAAKRVVIAGLGELKDKRALDLLAPLLALPGVAAEAALAAEKVRQLLYEATASHNPGDAKNAIDGDINTRWATNALQAPGMWFQLDMGGEAALKALVLDASRSKMDYPRAYEVYVFNDPAAMGAPVATGASEDAVQEIPLNGAKGRFVRIVQTGSAAGLWWSIHELRVVPAG